MCHMERKSIEYGGEDSWVNTIPVELKYERDWDLHVKFEGGNVSDCDTKCLRKRVNAFYENVEQLMDAYSFQIRKQFGVEKIWELFAWRAAHYDSGDTKSWLRGADRASFGL